MKITDKKDSFLNWVDTPPTDGQTPLRWLHKIARILLISLREMNENVLTLRAGYLTYAMLLSMVPILAMSTAVVKGLGGGDQIRELAYSYIDTLERTSTDFSISPSNEIASETQGEEGAETQPDLTTQL
ncbi:MAG: hypothetical protein HKN69_12900, partial [Desulfofustis sp.]|nr:hypothetical protein [Desulfofustis sp.]